MKFDEIPPLGQGLIAIGGTLLAVKVISLLTSSSGGSARENHLTEEEWKEFQQLRNRLKDPSWLSSVKSSHFTEVKARYNVLANKKFLTKSQSFIVETLPKTTVEVSQTEQHTMTGERKYPDHYYSLSKADQYKYRQKMTADLINISKEK